jgi:hypothetical protein
LGQVHADTKLPVSSLAQDAIGIAVASELARDYAAEVARDKSMRVRITAAPEPIEGVAPGGGASAGAGAAAPASTPSAGAQARAQDRLTRAQRHKRERHDAEVEAAMQRKAQRRFLADVDRWVSASCPPAPAPPLNTHAHTSPPSCTLLACTPSCGRAVWRRT